MKPEEAKVINDVLRASCEIVGPEEAHCPKDKGCPYCNHANAVDAYRAAGSPEVPTDEDEREIEQAIRALDEWEGITIQWVRCEEDDPPNGGVVFVCNAHRSLFIHVNNEDGTRREYPPVPDAEALDAAIELIDVGEWDETCPCSDCQRGKTLQPIIDYLRAMKGDKP